MKITVRGDGDTEYYETADMAIARIDRMIRSGVRRKVEVDIDPASVLPKYWNELTQEMMD